MHRPRSGVWSPCSSREACLVPRPVPGILPREHIPPFTWCLVQALKQAEEEYQEEHPEMEEEDEEEGEGEVGRPEARVVGSAVPAQCARGDTRRRSPPVAIEPEQSAREVRCLVGSPRERL